MSINAWAVSSKEFGIDVKTVSPTRQAAIINWLVAGQTNKQPLLVYDNMHRKMIEAEWFKRIARFDADVIEVVISAKE